MIGTNTLLTFCARSSNVVRLLLRCVAASRSTWVGGGQIVLGAVVRLWWPACCLVCITSSGSTCWLDDLTVTDVQPRELTISNHVACIPQLIDNRRPCKHARGSPLLAAKLANSVRIFMTQVASYGILWVIKMRLICRAYLGLSSKTATISHKCEKRSCTGLTEVMIKRHVFVHNVRITGLQSRLAYINPGPTICLSLINSFADQWISH